MPEFAEIGIVRTERNVNTAFYCSFGKSTKVSLEDKDPARICIGEGIVLIIRISYNGRD